MTQLFDPLDEAAAKRFLTIKDAGQTQHKVPTEWLYTQLERDLDTLGGVTLTNGRGWVAYVLESNGRIRSFVKPGYVPGKEMIVHPDRPWEQRVRLERIRDFCRDLLVAVAKASVAPGTHAVALYDHERVPSVMYIDADGDVVWDYHIDDAWERIFAQRDESIDHYVEECGRAHRMYMEHLAATGVNSTEMKKFAQNPTLAAGSSIITC